MKKTENLKLAIVISEFNTMITNSLKKSAIEYFVSQNVTPMQGLEEALNAVNRSFNFFNRRQDYLNKEVKVKHTFNQISKSPKMINEIKSKKLLREVALKIPNFLCLEDQNSDPENTDLED